MEKNERERESDMFQREIEKVREKEEDREINSER